MMYPRLFKLAGRPSTASSPSTETTASIRAPVGLTPPLIERREPLRRLVDDLQVRPPRGGRLTVTDDGVAGAGRRRRVGIGALETGKAEGNDRCERRESEAHASSDARASESIYSWAISREGRGGDLGHPQGHTQRSSRRDSSAGRSGRQREGIAEDRARETGPQVEAPRYGRDVALVAARRAGANAPVGGFRAKL